MRNPRFAALVLFLLAFAVRCIGLQWGLPTAQHWYSYHPDEFQMFGAISNLDFFSGDFNPDFFNYPSLYIYLAYCAHLILSGLGFGHPPPGSQAQVWMLMRDVLLSARIVTAVLGATTVPLVFFIARQIGGTKTGVLAALLLALTPGVVQHSHFATVDVPATFFVTLCLWLSTRALREDVETKWRNKQLLWSAFAAGLAAATKYNAGLVLLAPLLVWLFLRKKHSLSPKGVLGIIALSALGFFIGCPFSVFDFPTFWGDGKNTGISYELLVHPKQGHGDVFIGTGNGWLYHAFFNAPFLLTWPLLLAALIGIVKTRIVRRPETCTLFTWCAVYFFALGFSQVRFMRYLIPLAPTLCVFAAVGVLALRERRLKLVAGAILIFIVAWGTRDVLTPFVVEDSRDRAANWLSQHASTPATVGMIEPPWFFSPPLSPLDSPPFRRLTPEQLFKWSGGKYQFTFTGFGADKIEIQRSRLQMPLPQWFVVSEFEWREKARLGDVDYRKFRDALEQQYSLVARFKSTPPLALPGRDFVPHDFLYTNPEIRIYRRK
jgi:4-amino-4-deoxy-L-arabinose transferase-like glycosyltransferase